MIVGCVVILFSTESPKTAKADCFLFQRNIKNCWGGGGRRKTYQAVLNAWQLEEIFVLLVHPLKLIAG